MKIHRFPWVVAVLLLAAGSILHAADKSRPNVLFIAVDDLNDWVGFLDGNTQTITPNLDR
ncbi:MAG: choline-sulfatase, partial [Planctomycetaceae bacterium]|nr:choline-sulfatase [Planctomycetaceae bacterium]